MVVSRHFRCTETIIVMAADPPRLDRSNINRAGTNQLGESQSDSDQTDHLTRERVLVLVLLGVTVLAIFLCYKLVQPFLPAVTWAMALAVVARPLHGWVARRVNNRTAAAGISVALIALLLLAPILIVGSQIASEGMAALARLQKNGEWDSLESAAKEYPQLQQPLAWAREYLDIGTSVQSTASAVGRQATNVLGGSIWVVAQLMIMMLTLFFFLRDEQTVLQSIKRLVPLSSREADKVLTNVAGTIHATIFGTVVVALVQGILGGIMFYFLGLPAPLLWGSVMALLAIVPYLGAFVVWMPVAIFFAIQGEWGRSLLLFGWGSLVVGLIDNLLYPLLVGKQMRLHTLVAFFAVVGGIAVFGMSGIVLGPVVVAITMALMDIWRQRTAAGQGAEHTT